MASWDAEQVANARLIVAVGLEMGMSTRDITIGLMTAMQESSLRNLRYGDRDSLGLFQQRPSQGWGSVSQVTNPLYAARKFYSALGGVKNRDNLTMWGAAQAVQRSANPSAYAQWEGDAQRLLTQSGVRGSLPYPVAKPQMSLEMSGYLAGNASDAGTPAVKSVSTDQTSPAAPGAGASTGPIAAPQQPAPEALDLGDFPELTSHVSGIRGKLIGAAKQSLGTPYVWGGSAPGGFDCSGLIYYWYNKLGVKVPRVSFDQVTIGQRTSVNKLVPGDFVGFGSDAHHIAIYIGNNQILEAAHSGTNVRVRNLGKGENAWGVHLNLPSGVIEDKAVGYMQGPEGAPKMPADDAPLGVAAGATPSPLLNFPGL